MRSVALNEKTVRMRAHGEVCYLYKTLAPFTGLLVSGTTIGLEATEIPPFGKPLALKGRDPGSFHWAFSSELLVCPRLSGKPPAPKPLELVKKNRLIACVAITIDRPKEELDDQRNKLALRSARLGVLHLPVSSESLENTLNVASDPREKSKSASFIPGTTSPSNEDTV